MKVQEYHPQNKWVKKFVEKYQLFEGSGPFFIKAIPSGTSECWIVLKGRYQIFNQQKEKFEYSAKSGFFPLGGEAYTYYIRDPLRCFNIKLKPAVLGLPVFSNFIHNWKNTPVSCFLGEDVTSKIEKLDFSNASKLTECLDKMILETNDLSRVDPKIEQVLSSIFSPQNLTLKIGELASMNNLTLKSFERLVLKVCGMTPKKLLNIIRFGKSSSHLKNSEEAQFIDALAFGYYDQSHFIKECRRITNLNPTEFLSRLQLHVPDLVVEHKNENRESVHSKN